MDDEHLQQPVSSNLRTVGWWMLVGAASGAIAGLLVGGIGGRLAMLLLRLTSPDVVIGAVSDDGFEIGVVTTDTVQLVLSMALFGGINGVLYAALRGAIPTRLRLPLWTLLAMAGVGAAVIHDDGVDFTLIEPAVLAIALFLALPGLAAAVVVVLVERWADREPFADRRLVVVLVSGALLGTFAIAVAVVVGGVALALRSVGVAPTLIRAARVLVPALLVVVTAVSAVSLAGTISRIL
jgi:hypothetical protein